MSRILCLWFPAWPLQRLSAVRPELRAKAWLLRGQTSRSGPLVVACSAEASQKGVRAGMPLVEAAALGRQGGARLLVEDYDPAADFRALTQVAEWCERFSPLVGWEDPAFATGPQPGELPPLPGLPGKNLLRDRLLLDVSGISPLFQGEAGLAQRLLRELSEQFGYSARLAIADSLGAAYAVATGYEAPVESAPRAPLFPTGEVVGGWYGLVPTAATQSVLRDLPIETLRLPLETVRLLHELGMHQIAPLLQLPRSSLQCRFGQLLLDRLDQAQGTREERLIPHRTPPAFRAAQRLEYPVERREQVQELLRGVLEQIAKQLLQQGMGAVRLVCELDCSQGKTLRLQIDLFRPTAAVQHLVELFQLQLEPRPLPGGVEQVRMEAELAARLPQEQAELFQRGNREEGRPLIWLLERLSSRLGQAAVVRPRLQSEAQPERGYRYEPVTTRRRAAPRARTAAPPLGPRPLFLWEQPVPLEVLAIAPDGPPLRFRFENQDLHVTQHWGPERVETGWWRGRSVCRDYYRVETNLGAQYWLFRRLADGRWFLQGAFD